jgi:hypothetical protein
MSNVPGFSGAAAFYASLGDSKGAITLLKKACKEHSDYLIFLNI